MSVQHWFMAACGHVLFVLSDTGQVCVVQAIMCFCDAGGGCKVSPVIWQPQSPLWDLLAVRQ